MSGRQWVGQGLLLLIGAWLGFAMLCSMQEVKMVTTVCGKPYVLRVDYSAPWDRRGDVAYSDPNVDVEDCYSKEDSNN